MNNDPIYNGESLLKGATYFTNASFDRFGKFFPLLASRLQNVPYDAQALIRVLDDIISEFSSVTKRIDQEGALHLLIAKDLQQVRAVLIDTEHRKTLEGELDYQKTLFNCQTEAIKLLRFFELKFSDPELFFVDSYPNPYDQSLAWAMCLDRGDFEAHAMAPGVYFRYSFLRPIYSRFLLCHELIHVVLSEQSPNEYARGLEEGFAEIVGSLYLSSKILGVELTKNLFTYNRLSSNYSLFWERYLDYTRQAAVIYQRFGLDGIMSLLSAGRVKVKEVEKICLTKGIEKVELPKGHWDDDLSYLIHSLLFTFIRSEIVSPLAKYILPFLTPDRNCNTLIEELNLDPEAARKAFEELQNGASITTFKDNWTKVAWSDGPMLAEGSLVRYMIPE